MFRIVMLTLGLWQPAPITAEDVHLFPNDAAFYWHGYEVASAYRQWAYEERENGFPDQQWFFARLYAEADIRACIYSRLCQAKTPPVTSSDLENLAWIRSVIGHEAYARGDVPLPRAPWFPPLPRERCPP